MYLFVKNVSFFRNAGVCVCFVLIFINLILKKERKWITQIDLDTAVCFLGEAIAVVLRSTSYEVKES